MSICRKRRFDVIAKNLDWRFILVCHCFRISSLTSLIEAGPQVDNRLIGDFMNLECRHLLNQPLVKNDLEQSRFLAIQLSQKQWPGWRFQKIRKKPEVQEFRSLDDGLVPRLELSNIL